MTREGLHAAEPREARVVGEIASPAKPCVLCGMDISDRSQQASFCLGCLRIVRRKRDRDRGRMARRGLVLLPRCPRCAGAKPKWWRYCAPCTRALRAESLRRYYLNSGGAAQLRYGRSPKGKLVRGAYAEAHVETVRESKRAYARRHAASGTVIECSTVLCRGTFIRTHHNGRRIFCDECRSVFGLARIYRTRVRRAA